MIFSVFCGDADAVEEWERVVRRHASWLGRPARLEARVLASGERLSLARIARGPGPLPEWSERDGCLALRRRYGPECRVSLASGEIRARVGPTALEPFLHCADSRGRACGNDLRLLLRWTGIDLDEVAVFAILQNGAIPPPHTLSTRVHRLPGGRGLRWPAGSAVEIRDEFRCADLRAEHPEWDVERRLTETLDPLLAAVPREPVVFFSGGVDSSLLALRMREIGRDDVRLVNYSFGDDDPEADHAVRMAGALGLRFEQLRFDPRALGSFLDDFALDYSFPFGDYSAITTDLMVRAACGGVAAGRAAFDGTGADGAFGFEPKYRQWRRVYAIPRPLRRAVAAGYRTFGLWNRSSETALERWGRAIRKSVQMPLRHAGTTQHSLDGIAFRMPASVRRALESAIARGFDAPSEGCDPITRLAFMDLVHVCAAQFAAKSYEPMLRQGFEPVFPFLEPAMLRESLCMSWEEKCTGGEAKALLKRALVRHLPRDLIYRPKSGFDPPIAAILAHGRMQELIGDCVAPGANPILEFVQRDNVERMLRQIRERRPSSHAVYSFLWALISLSTWLARTPR